MAIKKPKTPSNHLFQMQIALAKGFAHAIHLNQTRPLSGEKYINHVARVANRFEPAQNQVDCDLVTIAWLHDVVEDGDCFLSDLEGLFPENILAAVDILSRRNESYEAYINRLIQSPYALLVKLADSSDNMECTMVAIGKIWASSSLKNKADFAWLKKQCDKAICLQQAIAGKHLMGDLWQTHLEKYTLLQSQQNAFINCSLALIKQIEERNE